MRILGIETSCDETGIAIYDSENGLLSNQLHSQARLHQGPYGGVVPELASRDHIRRIAPLLEAALQEAGLEPGDIDGVAYTAGPGLIGALLVGAGVGRSLAYAWGVPAVAVHHMEAHLLAVNLEADRPDYPFLALLVSGGHTQLLEVRAAGGLHDAGRITWTMRPVRRSIKRRNCLGWATPAVRACRRWRNAGAPASTRSRAPMTGRPGLDFSFSGLKTAVALVAGELEEGDEQACADVARAFVDAVVDSLAIKCERGGKTDRYQAAGGGGRGQRQQAAQGEIESNGR